MRKILICLILAIILSNCEISVKKAKAEANPNWTEEQYYPAEYKGNGGTFFKRIYIDSIEFGFFQSTATYSTGNPFVVNLTKEKLEIELLRKQLKK